ncbi:MAG TPA: hypothetical protein VEF76_09475 [Patescibacteria group bacterium]|nr:hypothetical protein [Patescibacteria group bacterium]
MVKLIDKANHSIDYISDTHGIRVSRRHCQLIAKTAGKWRAQGPEMELPVAVPVRDSFFICEPNETLRTLAYEYHNNHPTSDIARALAGDPRVLP